MADPDPKRKPDNQLHIQLDDDVAQGIYTNLAMVNHTETEFVLDFIYVQPQQPRAKVRTRLITSPRHTKRLLMALKDNVEKYEARFGAIEVAAGSGDPPVSLN
ncbi:MAG: DUF3467 domain-containing protein [Pseudomonadota bacterium]